MREGSEAPVHPSGEETKTEEAPDPSLTDEERETVKDAVEAMRGDLIKVKHVGPVVGAAGSSNWGSSARAPDGRIFSAPQAARSVLCFDPATGETKQLGSFRGMFKYENAGLTWPCFSRERSSTLLFAKIL